MPPHRPLPTIPTPLRPLHPLKPHNPHRHCPTHQPRRSPLVLPHRQHASPSTPPPPPPRPLHQTRPYSTTEPPATNPPSPRPYSVSEIQSLSASRNPRRLLIDVREPAELAATGRIPGALSMPLTSNPDALYLGDVEFLERFGWERPRARPRAHGASLAKGEGREAMSVRDSPFTLGMMRAREDGSGLDAEGAGEKEGEGEGDENGDGEQGGVEEVVFYCRAGVRSRAAARMAREWKGIKVGDMTGGWLEWEGKGGEVER